MLVARFQAGLRRCVHMYVRALMRRVILQAQRKHSKALAARLTSDWRRSISNTLVDGTQACRRY